MKTLLLSLGLITTITTVANSAISVKTSTDIINSTNNLSNYKEKEYKTELVETMNLKISNANEEEIKQLILDSLFLLNNQVHINTKLFDDLQDYQMKALFSDIKFENAIQEMYQNKMLIINDQGKFIFIDFNNIQPQIAGVWAVSHWYWFGWWKLVFDHSTSVSMTYLLDTLSGAMDLAEVIADWYPWSAVMLALFSAFCFANSLIFDSYDHGKGVWIGWYIVVPDMGWGSN